jgi:hypothetical protein
MTVTTSPFAITDVSVVVLAQDNNPTILNADFLRAQEIVPDRIGDLVPDSVLVTPAIATVRFSTGFSITLERGRLLVAESREELDPDDSLVPEVARRMTRVLPHVRYTAVGTNFTARWPVAEAEKFLTARFLREGPWNADARQVADIGLRLQYDIKEAQFQLSLESARAEGESFVLALGNVHRSWDEYPASEKIDRALDEYQRDLALFRDAVASALGDR